MEFDYKSITGKINQLNKYLTNACAVQSSEASLSTSSIIHSQDDQKKEERQIQDDCDSRISVSVDTEKKKAERDEGFLKKTKELDAKLRSVDKKYVKVADTINFAGITDDFKSELIIAINGSTPPNEKMVENIYLFFKSNSYEYISKPISPIIVVSKKRRKTYEQLAACLLIMPEFLALNKAAYVDERDEQIKDANDSAAQQVLSLRREFDTKLKKMIENAQSDNDFLLSESKKALKDIFDDSFYSACLSIKEKVHKCFSGINEEDCFPNEVYFGDVVFRLDDRILKNPIGETFVKDNKQFIENGVLFLPLTMLTRDCSSVFITPSTNGDKEDAIAVVNQYIYSFLRQLPLNGLELTIFDPEKRGNSILPFLSLHSIMPEMFSKKIFTSIEDINYRMQELDQYVDSVIQQKLSNKFDNIMEYNAATPDNPLPLKLVCLFDFPKFFEGRTYEYLESIIKNAKKCGIFVAILYNPSEVKNNTYGDVLTTIRNIKSESLCFVESGGILCVENSNLVVLPKELPRQSQLDDFCTQYEMACKQKLSRGIPFISVVKDGEFFAKSSAECISLPVGKGDGSVTQFIEFGKRSSQHAIITGATGSGKSTLLHTLIMSSVINYSPDELNLYLMDFKSGTEFKVYETIKVPHIKLLALDALQEFGESILIELVEEQKRRSQLFKENGEHTNIKSYVTATGKKMPRILVIMDEFQILFNENSNRKVAVHCAELANKIVTEGRAYGIHLIMATQTLRSIREQTTLNSSTIEQMRIRVGLKCGEEDATAIFGEANARDALLRMKGAIGTAVCNPEFTEANNSGFRVAYCSETEQKNLLSSIAATCSNKFDTTMKVFEGKRIPEFPKGLYESAIQGQDVSVALGEPIRIDEPITVCFSKKKNNNLLVVGSDVELMNRIMSITAYGVSLNNDTKLHYIDGNAFFDDPINPFIQELVNENQKVDSIVTRKEFIELVESLYEEFKKRRKNTSIDNTKHVVLINGMQYIDIFTMMLKGDYINRSDYIEDVSDEKSSSEADPLGLDLSSFGEDDNSIDYSSSIKELIELGYAYGIYFILSCSEYQTVKDVLHYGAGLLDKFSNRIIFSISDKDGDDLIDGVQVSGLNNVTAIYTDGIKRTLQFKPYNIPSKNVGGKE